MRLPGCTHPEHAAFSLLVFMSVTRLLSECHLLHDWPYYSHATNADTDFQVNSAAVKQHHHRGGARGGGRRGGHEGGGGGGGRPGLHRGREKSRGGWGPPPVAPSPRGERLREISVAEAKLGLYRDLKQQSALHATRLQAASTRPKLPPHYSHPATQDFHKRSFNRLEATPVCPSHAEWRLLREARDINDTLVEVFQPSDGSNGHQWFWVTTCLLHRGPTGLLTDVCHGIDDREYHSHCEQHKSFVIALVRKRSAGDEGAAGDEFDWNWIQVKSGCACFVSPR